ncbi:hypothetical protein B0H19DRAFT_1080843 [Mycena capillaripes]|nr:hypothetical protein B0H19DRAFT_1080843 [Mycena capillaripes]
MSLYLDGNLISSFSFSATSQTVVGSSLARDLHLSRTERLLLTMIVLSYGRFSTLVHVEFSKDISNHLVLGRDWAAHLRESLIFNGHTPGNGFNTWVFLMAVDHPLHASSSGPVPPPLQSLPSHTRTFLSVLIEPTSGFIDVTNTHVVKKS